MHNAELIESLNRTIGNWRGAANAMSDADGDGPVRRSLHHCATEIENIISEHAGTKAEIDENGMYLEYPQEIGTIVYVCDNYDLSTDIPYAVPCVITRSGKDRSLVSLVDSDRRRFSKDCEFYVDANSAVRARLNRGRKRLEKQLQYLNDAEAKLATP